MADTAPPVTATADDRPEWETHRRGKPIDEADRAFEHLYGNNMGWTLGVSRMQGHPSPEDCAGMVFCAEYGARGIPPWRDAPFRGYLWWKVKAECTRERRKAGQAERTESEWHAQQKAGPARPARATKPDPLPSVQPAAVSFPSLEESGEDPETLEEVLKDAPLGIALTLRRFPAINGQEAAHIYFRTQDLWSQTIQTLLQFPSVAAERTNWSRLNRKVKNLYGVDLNDEIRRLKPDRRKAQNG